MIPMEDAVNELPESGYVLYFRHAATDREQSDREFREAHSVTDSLPSGEALARCKLQRNLSAGGRAQSQQIGTLLRAADVRIADVFTNGYCRNRKTAEHAFPDQPIRIRDDALYHIPSIEDPDLRARVETEHARLLARIPEDGHTVLIGHDINLVYAADVSVPEGGAVVLEPDGEDFRVVERWAPLPPE